MKIIAITSAVPGGCQRFLVEAEDSELAIIAGNMTVHDSRLRIGTTIKVHDAWQIIGRHHRACHDLAEAAKTLRALAQLCEQQDPILVLPDPSKPTDTEIGAAP